MGTDTCDVNADCTDEIGSYTCVCHTGFSGDGETCSKLPIVIAMVLSLELYRASLYKPTSIALVIRVVSSAFTQIVLMDVYYFTMEQSLFRERGQC